MKKSMIWRNAMVRHFWSGVVTVVLGFTAALCGATGPAAAAFPDRPVHVVVPFPAGGSNDVVARFLGKKLYEVLGQQIIVDNRAGAGGNVGAEAVKLANPDGYTLLLTAPPPLAVNQSLYPNLAFDPATDFAPIALVASVQIVLAVNPAVKANNVRELIALAKSSPSMLSFGSSGYGSTNHLAGELLKKLAGVDIVHVPYRGAAPAMNDLVSGQIAILFDNMPAVRPQALAGAIRPLAVSGPTRSPLFPELPTMVEAGVPGFEASSWFGLVAPAKTPPEVMKTLTDAVTKVLRDPDLAKQLADVGAEPGTLSGAEFGAFLHAESDKWGKLIKDAGVVIQ
jgi:tripartite-type tricarboxylate transporter receptor subunit TctC